MIQYAAAYAATACVMVALDFIWLGVIAKPIYKEGIGHLLAARPNLWVAVIFYLVFAVGLMYFAVAANDAGAAWRKTLLSAALFGFFAYATYDLTNLATLKNWPIGVSIIDVAWGTLVSTIAAAAGKLAWDRFPAA